MPIQRPCLTCRNLTTNIKRCDPCQAAWERNRNEARTHYKGDYQRRAKQVRDTATTCWLCGQGPKEGDPFQADHVEPGKRDSELRAAHRSCNAARGNAKRPR